MTLVLPVHRGQSGPGGSGLDVALSDRLPGLDAMPREAKSLERFDSVPWLQKISPKKKNIYISTKKMERLIFD